MLVSNDLGQDCYAFFDKKIIFSTNNILDDVINAVVVMETGDDHTELDPFDSFNLEGLSKNEVAVSSNILNRYHLKIGDSLFFKKKTSNLVSEYHISLELPELFGFKKEDTSPEKGVVVMGRDEEYLSEIETPYLFFFDGDDSLVRQKGATIIGQLTSIEDVRMNTFGKRLSFVGIVSALLIVVNLGLAVSLISFNHGIYLFLTKRGYRWVKRHIIRDSIAYWLLVDLLALGIFAFTPHFCIDVLLLCLFIAAISCISLILVENARLQGV